MTHKKKINWVNTLFLTLVLVIGVVGTIWIAHAGHLKMPTVYLASAFMFATGLAITAGYHRLFSHRAYRTAWPVRAFFLLLGAAAFEGSVLEWCTDHRRHHLYVDTDKDPYNINQGFWHAHMGWLIYLDPSKRDFKNVSDLSADPLVQLQHRFFVPIAILMGFILPMGIASIWGDPLGGLIIAGALRIGLNQQLTFCINSVCHMLGGRPYSEKQTARDNWVTALFTYGEGFHNFHHQFMFDYRNGIRFYHFDPAKWLIKSLSFLGLAKDLKRATPKQILRYTVRVDEHHVLSALKQHSDSLAQQAERLIEPLRESILQSASRLEQLEKDYIALKTCKLEHPNLNLIRGKKEQVKLARSELANALHHWQLFLKHPVTV